MTDSTPTAVTVSDRMRELVYAVHRAAIEDGYNDCAPEEESDTDRSIHALLREIAWLETLVDQRGKRIEELEEENAFLDKDRDRLTLEVLALEDSAVLQKEELEQVKGQLAKHHTEQRTWFEPSGACAACGAVPQ